MRSVFIDVGRDIRLGERMELRARIMLMIRIPRIVLCYSDWRLLLLRVMEIVPSRTG